MSNMVRSDIKQKIDELAGVLHRYCNSAEVDASDNYGQPPEYIDVPTPYLPGKFVAPTGTQRYVRAPFCEESLEDGQYRWIRVNEGDAWEPAAIMIGFFSDRLVYFITGYEYSEYVEDCYEVGPVIIPPAGE